MVSPYLARVLAQEWQRDRLTDADRHRRVRRGDARLHRARRRGAGEVN